MMLAQHSDPLLSDALAPLRIMLTPMGWRPEGTFTDEALVN